MSPDDNEHVTPNEEFFYGDLQVSLESYVFEGLR